MAKKRGHGEGTIYQRKNGLWCTQVTVGYNGKKTKRVTLYGKSKKEVLEKLTQILHQKQTGGLLEPTKVTLGEWLDRWLNDYMKPHLRQNTWGDYESIIRVHIKPALGQRLLRKL